MTLKKLFKFLLVCLLVFLIAVPVLIMYSSPDNVRYPKYEHFHFRMQYIYRGEAENFGAPKYQVDYVKDVCSGALTESPIHFHDNRDQIVHLHWQKITGGQVLKFYGLNLIGGLDGYMGFKLDEITTKYKITPVPIYANLLPKPQAKDKFWVYIQDSKENNGYVKKSIEDFINQDLEKFFGQSSKIRESLDKEEKAKNKKTSFLPLLPVAKAHEGVEHADLTEEMLHEQQVKKEAQEKADLEARNNVVIAAPKENLDQSLDQELKDINNLLGDVVIFVQPDEPSSEQISARFKKLEPLSKSVCGG